MVRKNAGFILLLIITIAIKIFSLFPDLVEKYYSQGFYLYISRLQRFLLGWIPFSFGDFLYGLAGIWLVIKLSRFVFRLTRERFNRLYVFKTIRKALLIFLVIYAWFNISWGLNYNRQLIVRLNGTFEQMTFFCLVSCAFHKLTDKVNSVFRKAAS